MSSPTEPVGDPKVILQPESDWETHAGHVTDHVHHAGLVRLRATFVDDRQFAFQALGHGAGAYNTADVRRNHHQVFVVLALDIVQQYRRAVHVIHRHIEEALDLLGVQVDVSELSDLELSARTNLASISSSKAVTIRSSSP